MLVLGITFKEGIPDIRNSRVIDVIRELEDFGCAVGVTDPWADADEAKHEYNLDLITNEQPLNTKDYDAVILAVAHKEFKKLNSQLSTLNFQLVTFDIKAFLDESDGKL